MYVPYAAASGRRSEPKEVDVGGSLVFLSQSALTLAAETEVSIIRHESDAVAHSAWDLRPSQRCRSCRWASERYGSVRYRVDLRRHDSLRHELARAAAHDHGVGGKRLMGVTPRSAAAERAGFKRQSRTDWSRQWTGRQRGRSGPSGTSGGLTTVGFACCRLRLQTPWSTTSSEPGTALPVFGEQGLARAPRASWRAGVVRYFNPSTLGSLAA